MKILQNLSFVPIFLSSLLCAIETAPHKVTLLMPINWTIQEHHNLAISIPEGFQSLQPLDQFGDAKSTLIEFIPDNETANDWNRSITVSKYIGSKLSASRIADALKTQISKQARNVRVLEYNVTKGQFFEKAIFALSYDYHAKHEVIAGQYFSGPCDLTGVQYTLRTTRGQSDASALDEIHSFFNEQVQVMN